MSITKVQPPRESYQKTKTNLTNFLFAIKPLTNNMSRYITCLGAVSAMNLLPTQGSNFPSMHESPVVQLRWVIAVSCHVNNQEFENFYNGDTHEFEDFYSVDNKELQDFSRKC